MLLLSHTAKAQFVSLDSCRNMAIRNNKTVKVASEGIVSAEYLSKAAKSTYLPGFDFNMLYTYNQNKISLLGEDAKLPTMSFDAATGTYQYNLVRNPQTGELVVNPSTGQPIPSEVAVIPKEALSYDTHNVVAGAITMIQPVYMGGEIRALNQMAKYGEELAASMKNSAVQEIIYGVDEAYWTVVSLREKKKLAESYVNLLDSLKFNVNAMLKEGIATKSDLLNVEVRCNEAQISLTKVNNGLSLSRMALAQLCGLPIDSQLEPQDGCLNNENNLPEQYTYSMDDVYASRPDLQSLSYGINILEQKEKIAMAQMLPKLAIVGAYSFSNPNVIDGFEKRFGGGFSIGATLSIPIWHWGGNYNKYRSAKAQTNMQRLLLEDAQEKVSLQVNQARFKFEEAFKTYDMTGVNMDKADENLRQAQLGFYEGVLTSEDVMKAQTAWLQASSERIDAAIGIQMCKVYLTKVLGRLDY